MRDGNILSLNFPSFYLHVYLLGACAVLHNLAIMFREPVVEDDLDVAIDGNIQGQYNGPEDGKNIRNYIMQHYF